VLNYAGRDGSAAPASGYMSVHLDEQKKFINEALTFDS
jgi:2-oxoglutarate dehydrogenase E1 component